MPAMNGIELVAKIKGMPQAMQVPVIAMTARGDIDAGLLAQHGFAACLHKPFTGRELLSAISDSLNGTSGKFDFAQLTAFSMDDADAKREIMNTFVVETKKKRDLLKLAADRRDMPAVTMLTHQLLPLFAMVGAVDGKESLEWFEKRRNEQFYPDEADAKVASIIADVDDMVKEAEKEMMI